MQSHDLVSELERQRASGRPYHEFIRVPDLSVGLYVLPAGGVDQQQPHEEDEVYHVIRGRGRITVGDETHDVREGSVVYVAARVPHRFHDIDDELAILVFFAPAETGVSEPSGPG